MGTHFNVNAYEDEASIRTTLLEGKVRVKTNKDAMILAPGSQAELQRSTRQLSTHRGVDVDQVVAWRFGYFRFDQSDLKTIMRQLARWYDLEVVYEDEGRMSSDLFQGEIPRTTKLSSVLKVMETSNVHFRLKGNKLTVFP
jgi:transmembrane sensor